MSHYRRIFVPLAIFLSGVALIPYVSLSSEPISWQMFADVYEPDQPTLDINYHTGKPGSFFTLTGSDFPADDVATISVNGNVLGSVATDGKGDLIFLLDTAVATEGFYGVAAAVNPSAQTGFLLDSDSALRLQEDSGTVFQVPSGVGYTEFLYLPIITR